MCHHREEARLRLAASINHMSENCADGASEFNVVGLNRR